MNQINTSFSLIIILLGILFVFLLFNNVMHVGIHIGHSHKDIHHLTGEHGHDDSVAFYEIYPGDVADKIANKEDIILLDVRTPEEYTEIHLEDSLLLPVGDLSSNTLADIGLGDNMRDKEIIIYCRSGARSKQAYEIMNSLGYTNIKSISGGIVHWQEDNYPFTEIGEYKEVLVDSVQSGGTGPKIAFNRTTYDFGDIPQSKGVIETYFEVQNVGEEVLEIGELSTSCGCTTAKISNKSIQPSSTAILTVYFDPNFHEEPADKITRTVFIPTNDPNSPETEVKIMVDILEGE